MSILTNPKPPDRSPRNKTEIATIAILGVFFGGMILAGILQDYSIYKLSIPLFMVSWTVLLVLHRCGQVLMACALGWRISRISIASGRVIAHRTVFGIKVDIRGVPVAGFVQPRPTDLIHPQLKSFLIYAAGPGIELFFVALLWIFLGRDTLLSHQPILWLIGAQSFSAAAIMGALVNLIPFTHENELGKNPSDGAGMILAWQLPDQRYAEWIESSRE